MTYLPAMLHPMILCLNAALVCVLAASQDTMLWAGSAIGVNLVAIVYAAVMFYFSDTSQKDRRDPERSNSSKRIIRYNTSDHH